jgi:hypothetical protein
MPSSLTRIWYEGGHVQHNDDEDDDRSRTRAPVRVEFAASLAMLDLARRLPLEELSMRGRYVDPVSTPMADFQTSIASCSPDHAHDELQDMDSGHNPLPIRARLCCNANSEGALGTHAQTIPAWQSQWSRSHTVSFSSSDSDSTWSFGCWSARRLEREFGCDAAAAAADDDDSISGGGHPIDGRPIHVAFMSDAEFAALPDWSDVEDESEDEMW